jgi:hypothetical protein
MSALNGIVGLIPHASVPKKVSSKYTKIKPHTLTERTEEDSPVLKCCGLECATALTGRNT